MQTASEGGAWGIAVLARYHVDHQGQKLSDYLDHHAFGDVEALVLEPKVEDVESFKQYIERFEAGLPLERQADTHFNS